MVGKAISSCLRSGSHHKNQKNASADVGKTLYEKINMEKSIFIKRIIQVNLLFILPFLHAKGGMYS